MGIGASLATLTKDDVANYVKAIPKLEKCGDTLLENDVDGTMLLGLRDEDIPDFLTEIGIKSAVQKAKLTGEIIKIKNNLLASSSSPLPEVVNKFETQFMVFGDDEDFKKVLRSSGPQKPNGTQKT
jgi:hypothetical protein